MLAGLLGAVIWNLITWWLGLPTSSSHALIGGYAGAGLAKAGFEGLVRGKWLTTISFIVLSPLIGMILAYILMLAVHWIFRRTPPSRADRYFRRLQLLSSALFSCAHGTNDTPENDGHYHGHAHQHVGYQKDSHIRPWVIALAKFRDRDGHAERGMANREDDGVAADAAEAPQRLLRGNRSCDCDLFPDAAWASGFDDACDCGFDRGRGVGQSPEGSTVGGGRGDCVGVGAYDSVLGVRCLGLFSGDPGVLSCGVSGVSKVSAPGITTRASFREHDDRAARRQHHKHRFDCGAVCCGGPRRYNASKHALIGVTRTLAAEWGGYGVRCNAVCPGWVKTEMDAADQGSGNYRDADIIHRVPMGRFASPDDIAQAIAFLSDAATSGFINGQTIVVDGGWTTDATWESLRLAHRPAALS